MRTIIRAGILATLLSALAVVIGCAGNPAISCQGSTVIAVNPTSATVDHAAAPPGNQIQFLGVAHPTAPPGCPVPEWVALVYGTWSNPDPADIQISSASDSTNGTAVCKAATGGAVTLTGTFSALVPAPVAETVQLTCN